MGLIKQDIDYGRFSSADALALKMFNHPLRWFTTVGLQGSLGLFFLFFPGATMAILWVPDSAHTGAVFQLYGALLLYRAVAEQLVRRRLDPEYCRNYMTATIPFSIGSSVVLTYASVKGLMNYWIGAVWIAMFVLELCEFLYALNRSRKERRTPAGQQNASDAA
jgi:low temperature requirement protein LtrA